MTKNTPEQTRGIVTRFVGDVFSTDKKIGDLNGKWAVLLKIVVLTGGIITPLLLTWTVWVTSNIFATQHHVYDTHDFRQRIVHIEKVLESTPERIQSNKIELQELKREVKAVNDNNTSDHQDILIQLSKIQTKLELLNEDE